ncbi:unnamed protein product [Caenorhabditis nigoni]
MCVFAMYSLIYSWIEVLTQPVMHIKGQVFIVYMDSPLKPYKWIGMEITCIFRKSVCFSTILYCAFNIYWTMKKSQDHMSARTLELNHQLFVTLTFQTVLPFCMMYSPVGLLMTFPLFEVYVGKIANYVGASLAVYPALEPLIAMFCIKDFRRALL